MLEYVFSVKGVPCNLPSQQLDNVLSRYGSVGSELKYMYFFLSWDPQWKDKRKNRQYIRIKRNGKGTKKL